MCTNTLRNLEACLIQKCRDWYWETGNNFIIPFYLQWSVTEASSTCSVNSTHASHSQPQCPHCHMYSSMHVISTAVHIQRVKHSDDNMWSAWYICMFIVCKIHGRKLMTSCDNYELCTVENSWSEGDNHLSPLGKVMFWNAMNYFVWISLVLMYIASCFFKLTSVSNQYLK